MTASEIVNMIQKRINELEEKRKDYSIGSPLHEMMGVRITELRGVILDIVEGCFKEIEENIKRKEKEEKVENAWNELFYQL